ncbi:hypothetical protein [Streptococcus suis]
MAVLLAFSRFINQFRQNGVPQATLLGTTKETPDSWVRRENMREHAPVAACFSDIQGGVHEFSFRPFIGAMFGEIGFKLSLFLIG